MSSIFLKNFFDDGFYPHCFRIGPGEVFGIVFFFSPSFSRLSVQAVQ
jgi:hypothetical protein